jgi:archaellum biogenesis ATPase FlaH
MIFISNDARSHEHKIPHYLIKGKIFLGKKIIEQKMCFGFLYKYGLKMFFILRRTERDMVKTVHWTSCEVPVMLVSF